MGHFSMALSFLSAAGWFSMAAANIRLSRKRQLVLSDCIASIDDFVPVEAIFFGSLPQDFPNLPNFKKLLDGNLLLAGANN